MNANVGKAVPFLRVTDMESSLHFYVDGLGFRITRQWIPEDESHYPVAGKIVWCMLQEFMPQSRPKEALGIGASISFSCQDALTLYREFKSRGVQVRSRPSVGNGLWVVPLADPDGYLIDFSSPTDSPEESELME